MSDPYREYQPVRVERVERGGWSRTLMLLLLGAFLAIATLMGLDAMRPDPKHATPSPDAKRATTGVAPSARPIDSRAADNSVDPRKYSPGGRLDAAKSGDDAVDARRGHRDDRVQDRRCGHRRQEAPRPQEVAHQVKPQKTLGPPVMRCA